MTIVEKSCTNKNYHITIEIEFKYNKPLYVVQACPLIGEHLCGYPEREMVYSFEEREKAYNTFRRYKKKYI